MSGIPSSHPTFEDSGQPMRQKDRIGDGKYVVFKVEEFYEFARELWNLGWDHDSSSVEEIAEPLVVMDATVLRDQDILTAPALNSYADAALTVADLLRHFHVNGEQYPTLIERADFFRARAMRAQQAPNRRLPD